MLSSVVHFAGSLLKPAGEAFLDSPHDIYVHLCFSFLSVSLGHFHSKTSVISYIFLYPGSVVFGRSQKMEMWVNKPVVILAMDSAVKCECNLCTC